MHRFVLVLLVALAGCAPGKEVATIRGELDETHAATFQAKKGDTLHFWETFNVGSKKIVFNKDRCFRWTIRVREAKKKKRRKLRCWAHNTSSRCKSKSGSTRENCKIDDCTMVVKKSGEVEVEAKIETENDCALILHTSKLHVHRERD